MLEMQMNIMGGSYAPPQRITPGESNVNVTVTKLQPTNMKKEEEKRDQRKPAFTNTKTKR